MRSSIFDAGQPLTSLVSVSVSQACGFTRLSLQVSMSEAMIAQLAPPSSLLAKSAFFRCSAMERMLRSTVLLSMCRAWHRHRRRHRVGLLLEPLPPALLRPCEKRQRAFAILSVQNVLCALRRNTLSAAAQAPPADYSAGKAVAVLRGECASSGRCRIGLVPYVATGNSRCRVPTCRLRGKPEPR